MCRFFQPTALYPVVTSRTCVHNRITNVHPHIITKYRQPEDRLTRDRKGRLEYKRSDRVLDLLCEKAASGGKAVSDGIGCE